jgi:hypothetical protein
MDKSILVGGDVQGNITSCENKEVIVYVDKKGAFSLIETKTHMIYNQCTGEEVSRYEYQDGTVFSGLLLIFAGVLIIVVTLGWFQTRW